MADLAPPLDTTGRTGRMPGVRLMAADCITDQELADLVRGVTEAARAIIRGDMRAYVDFINHADDYTLMPPSGGEPRRGFDDSPEALEAMSRYFRGGEADLEVFGSYTSGNLAVLVAIERQHGEVGDLPDQDLSLRVTLVFRKAAGPVATGASPCRPLGPRTRTRPAVDPSPRRHRARVAPVAPKNDGSQPAGRRRAVSGSGRTENGFSRHGRITTLVLSTNSATPAHTDVFLGRRAS